MPTTAIDAIAEFVVGAQAPGEARAVACAAYLDTVGVMLAGAGEPAARAVQEVALGEGSEPRCTIVGTGDAASASWAALANGTAAHALDYDDMCFVSLAHPSAPLVAAALAVGELVGAPGRALLDAWVAGFEVEAVLGRAMNPRHYTQGWHCTSTIGTIGAAAAAGRLLGLDRAAMAHCFALAASEASGLKENFGTMAKPLHAGLAARNGVVAAMLARSGLTGSGSALDGPQGFLVAMGSERPDLGPVLAELGGRWETLATGVTVKLYPSCAGTHPALDAILDLRRQHAFTAADVDWVTVGVDAVTPTILIHPRPVSGLEAKFSMQFCAAAALVTGRVDLDTFEPPLVDDPRIRELLQRVTMTVDDTLRAGAATLTQARVSVGLRDGRTFSVYADGARGYPDRPASDEDTAAKFVACAGRVLDPDGIANAIGLLQTLDQLTDARVFTQALRPATSTPTRREGQTSAG